MPSKPNDNFIYREIDDEDLKSLLNQFSEKIEETVNFGSQVSKWSLDNMTGGDEKLPILLSYRHAFELIDSISILVRISCIDPCKILLRAIFESILTIEYILEKNTEQRAIDFLVWITHQEIKFHRRWDPDDQMCKDFRKKLEKDKILKDWELIELPHVKDEIEKRKKTLKMPKYLQSEKEYRRLKRELNGHPRWWFSLHGGPINLERLAEHLDRQGQYEVLYRHMSSAAHGTDIIRNKVERINEKHVAISQLRLADDAVFVTQMAINFALIIIRLFTEFFVPKKRDRINKWQIEEIKEFNESLSGKRIIGIQRPEQESETK